MPKNWVLQLETSNFGSSYVFSSPSKWGGRFLPNLTFWTPKRHISGKCRYHYSKICVSWDKCMKFWLQPWFWEPVKIGGSDFTQFDVKNSKTAYFRYIGSNCKSHIIFLSLFTMHQTSVKTRRIKHFFGEMLACFYHLA